MRTDVIFIFCVRSVHHFEQLDLDLGLVEEWLLVFDNLNGYIALLHVVVGLHHLPKRPFANGGIDLVSETSRSISPSLIKVRNTVLNRAFELAQVDEYNSLFNSSPKILVTAHKLTKKILRDKLARLRELTAVFWGAQLAHKI